MGFCQRCTKQSWRLWVSVNVAQNNVGVYGFLLALHKTMLVFMGFCQRCTKQGWCLWVSVSVAQNNVGVIPPLLATLLAKGD